MNMTSYQRILAVIDDMINNTKKHNTTKYQKPHFMRFLLSEQIHFRETLNQTLRDNDRTIRELWMTEMQSTNIPDYYTIVGAIIVKYLNNELERDLLSLTSTEKQRLIQEIIEKTNRTD